MLKKLGMAMGLVAAMATTGSAASVYGTDVDAANYGTSGTPITRSLGAIAGTGTYSSLSVAWYITQSAGVFHYDYVFNTNTQSPTFSHVILEVSNGATLSNLAVNGNSVNPDAVLGLYHPNPGNNSNPGLPADIYGYKITPGGVSTLHLTFDTDRAPVWGNFYTKGNNTNYAWNTGMGISGFDSDNINFFIARPDSHGAVPEPSSIALLGCGAIGLMGVAARRRKSRLA